MSLNFIPTVWAARLLSALEKSLVYGQAGVVNRDYEGEITASGDTVKIGSIGDPTIGTYTKDTDISVQALTDAEQTFCLTAGGHNAGIINPPQQARTSHRLRLWRSGDPLLTPDQWLEKTPLTEGSWWTPWFDWLHARSGPWRHPPTMGAPEQGLPPLQAAPGRHVLAP